MGSYMDNAFPAGDESDASNDEWDIGCTDKKFSQNKVGLEKNALRLLVKPVYAAGAGGQR